MAAFWNPRRLLDVDPDGPFTCVGTTQKGARCRNFYFSNSDLSKASNLLDRMAASDPRDARAHLSNLAELTLCPRWHRKPGYSQVESMKSKWWSLIVSNYPEPRPRPRSREPTTALASIQERRSRITRQLSESVESTSTSRSLPTPPLSPLPATRRRPLTPSTPVVRTLTPATSPTSTVPTQAPREQPVRSRAITIASVSSSTSSTSTRAALITPPQSPRQARSRSQNDNSSPSSPVMAPITVTSSSRTPPSTPRSQRSQSIRTWLPLTPERSIRPSPPTCPHSSRRKPLTEECPICNEDMHCLDDAVWCRAQCGTNVHRGCFAEWRRSCLDREATVTCVYCRAPWKYEWED